jgi:hypothetical protein
MGHVDVDPEVAAMPHHGPDPCPPYMPVTQDVIIDGKVVTVRMCSKCGTRL